VMRGAENDLSDFPQRRRSTENPALINLDSPAMQAVSLPHPLSTVG